MRNVHRFSRRHFLAAAAVAAAPLPWPAHADGAPRVALLGCGRRGSELARRLGSGHAATLACVCDPDPARRAAVPHGIDSFDDPATVWADPRIDAVVIATPDHLHAPLALAALAAGKHVYIETPMSRDPAEARAIAEAAGRTGRIVAVGVDAASGGPWRSAAACIRRGALGPIRWAQASHRLPAPDAEPAWRARPECTGGPAVERLFTALAPFVATLGLGLPKRVSAAGSPARPMPDELPEALMATFDYAGGARILIATAAHDAPPILRGALDSVEIAPAESAPAPALDDFLHAIRTGARPAVDADAGCRTQIAAALALQAWREGRSLSPRVET